jgi:hypothetical protein
MDSGQAWTGGLVSPVHRTLLPAQTEELAGAEGTACIFAFLYLLYTGEGTRCCEHALLQPAANAALADALLARQEVPAWNTWCWGLLANILPCCRTLCFYAAHICACLRRSWTLTLLASSCAGILTCALERRRAHAFSSSAWGNAVLYPGAGGDALPRSCAGRRKT